MIEIAPSNYWKKCTPAEALLYCFSLEIDGKIGWRLPTMSEWLSNFNQPIECLSDFWIGNIEPGELTFYDDWQLTVAPVRDLQ